MITLNEADKILSQHPNGTRRYYKRLEVEDLHRFIIHLVDIELEALSDDFFYNKQEDSFEQKKVA
jgi:hypothetical protein